MLEKFFPQYIISLIGGFFFGSFCNSGVGFKAKSLGFGSSKKYGPLMCQFPKCRSPKGSTVVYMFLCQKRFLDLSYVCNFGKVWI